MDEMKMQGKLRNALREPKAPAPLVERTVQAARAVRIGREAREHLTQRGARFSEEQTALLAAQVLVGKLASQQIPPAGATAEGMTGLLMQNADFRKEAAQHPDSLLRRIDDGSLAKQLAQSRNPQKAAAAEPKKKQEPTPPMR